MTDLSLRVPARTRLRLDALIVLPLVFAVLGIAIRALATYGITGNADPAALVTALCKWDCFWYETLAEKGYNPFPNVPAMIDHGNWAFFPGYPALIALLRLAIPVPTVLLASIVSIVLTLLTTYASRPWFGANTRGYLLFAAFMLAGPVSFYFATFLSEVLFVFLSVLVFVALQRSAFVKAGIAAAFLSGTRIVGAFIVFAFLMQAFLDHRQAGGKVRDFPRAVLGNGDLVLAIMLAPLGAFAYMLFLHLWIGDGLAFAHVQRAWAREYGNPLTILWEGFSTLPAPGASEWLTAPQILGVATLFGFALVGLLGFQRRWPEALFGLFAILIPLFAGLASMLRFVAGLAPATMGLCAALGKGPVRFWVSLLAFLILCFWGTQLWVTGHVALI